MRVVRPVVECASGRLFGEVRKARHDLIIRATLHAPEPMGTMRLRIYRQRAPLRKPEIENIVPFLTIFDGSHVTSVTKMPGTPRNIKPAPRRRGFPGEACMFRYAGTRSAVRAIAAL